MRSLGGDDGTGSRGGDGERAERRLEVVIAEAASDHWELTEGVNASTHAVRDGLGGGAGVLAEEADGACGAGSARPAASEAGGGGGLGVEHAIRVSSCDLGPTVVAGGESREMLVDAC